MAYDATTLTRLAHLKQLAQKTAQETEALRSAMPTKVSDLTNDSGFQTGAQVEASIASALTSAYKAAGSKAFNELTVELLTAANAGKVFNVSNAFTTNANFVEGAGKKHTAGTNVVIVEATPADNSDPQNPVAATYKYDVISSFVDLDNYQELVDSPTAGNFAGLDANGQVTDSGKKAADFVLAETGKRLMSDAEGTKLAGISESATKVEASATPGDGTIKIDGTTVTVYTLPGTVLHSTQIAKDAEITEMLNEVFGSSSSGSGE